MQGEVLSPILFNLYVNDFETNFLKSGCIPNELSTFSLFFCLCMPILETGGYNKTNRIDRKCFNCSDYVEDEFHFILVCP